MSSPVAARDAVSVRAEHPAARDPFLDNARFLLMVSIVVGHAMARMRGLDGVEAAYFWLYTFHFPAFLLLTGYTSRSYEGRPHQVRRAVASLVLPYLVVHSALHVQRAAHREEPLFADFELLDPTWLAWFLLALFVWRSTTPVWRALRLPVLVAVVISLLSGLTNIPAVLALDKVLGYLPFYVLGLQLRAEHFARLGHWRFRVVAVALLTGALLACWVNVQDPDIRWLLWTAPYSSLGVEPVEGVAIRTALLVVALLLAAAVLSLVPRHRGWYSSLGERTLYAYLLHGFAVRLAGQEGWLRDLEPHGLVAAAGVAGCFALLAAALMTGSVRRLFQPLFEPRLDWLFKPDPPR